MFNLLCWWNKNKVNEHKFRLVANFRDVEGGRAIYQCSRCGFTDVDAPEEFHIQMAKKGVKTRVNWHQPYLKASK